MKETQGQLSVSKKLLEYTKLIKDEIFTITEKKYSPSIILEAACLLMLEKKNYKDLEPYIIYVKMERYKKLMQLEEGKIQDKQEEIKKLITPQEETKTNEVKER